METDPTSHSRAQTPAIARENLLRALLPQICENMPITYGILYDPPSNWNDLVSPKT